MGSEFVFVAVAIVVCVAGVMTLLVVGRSKEIVHAWAEAQGYELLTCEYRLARRGPFFFTSSSEQGVCRISVRTPDGATRDGWIKCGSFLWGVPTDKTKVLWDQ